MGPRVKPEGDDWWHSEKEKSRLPAGPSLLSLGSSVRTNGRPCPVGQVSGPDDSGLAVAVRASGRRPAADRASDSDSAGPDSGWGWTSGSPWLNVVPDNQAGGNWLQGNLEVSGLFRGGRLSRLWRREPRGLNLPMYKPLTPTPRCCRTGFPLLEKPKLEKSQHATCRLLGQSFRLAPMLSASGMSFVLSNYSQSAQGARVKPVPPIITGGYTLSDQHGFVVRLSNTQIIVVLTTIVLLAIFTWLVAKTRLRRDMRACEQGHTMAALAGVAAAPPISIAFVIV